jgi:predicted DNA-binding transcriptional regulator YafY
MPKSVTVNASFLDEQVSFISGHYGQIDAKVFETVFTALKTSQTLNFEYSPKQLSTYMERSADPYHVICNHGIWYFIGYCHAMKEPRMFAFSRLKKPVLTGEKFTIPADFRPEDYFDKDIGVYASARTPYTVEIVVSGEAATYALERNWHSTQTVTQQPDGSVYVKFTTTQIPYVMRWVLSQGDTVKVLQPQELVNMVRDEAAKVVDIYRNKN